MSTLETLLKTPGLWRGNACAEVALPSVPSGYPALDEQLPGGGWPTGALTEILPERPGIGELRLLLPALARLSREDRWVVVVGGAALCALRSGPGRRRRGAGAAAVAAAGT